jgi:hypothetical protein
VQLASQVDLGRHEVMIWDVRKHPPDSIDLLCCSAVNLNHGSNSLVKINAPDPYT